MLYGNRQELHQKILILLESEQNKNFPGLAYHCLKLLETSKEVSSEHVMKTLRFLKDATEVIQVGGKEYWSEKFKKISNIAVSEQFSKEHEILVRDIAFRLQ